MEYLITFGREKDLSAAELVAVSSILERGKKSGALGSDTFPTGCNLQNLCLQKSAGIIELENNENAKQVFDILGGSIRIAEIFSKIDVPSFDKISSTVTELGFIDELANIKEKRPILGVSVVDDTKQNQSKCLELAKKIGHWVKEHFKSQNASLRYIGFKPDTQFAELTSVQVGENCLDSGMEIFIYITSSGVYICKTIAVQDYKSFEYRDMYKPERRLLEGILPPKLARIMVNISQINRSPDDNFILLDPFCGSGVLLMEAVLLALKCIGSDIDDDALDASKNNLAWLAKEFNISQKVDLRKLDATNLISKIKPLSISAIATETHLGPPIRGVPDRNTALIWKKELKPMILRALGECRTILKPNGTLIAAIPVWHTKEGNIYLSIEKELEIMGYKPIKQIEGLMPRGPYAGFLHHRPDQKVYRQIIALKS